MGIMARGSSVRVSARTWRRCLSLPPQAQHQIELFYLTVELDFKHLLRTLRILDRSHICLQSYEGINQLGAVPSQLKVETFHVSCYDVPREFLTLLGCKKFNTKT